MSFVPLANPLPVTSSKVVDQLNSNVTPIAANTTITNSWVNVLGYSQISTTIITDQNSAANGFKIQYSSDGANVDHEHSYSVFANSSFVSMVPVHLKYYRTVYTNGVTPQSSFRMQSLLHPIAATGSIIEADSTISGDDECVITKSILTGQSAIDNTYINAKMTPDGGLLINQYISIDPLNSSTANLAANATFTGTGVTNITATAIQVFLKTDQNCEVFIDQSQDGTNWDVTDSYHYYEAIANFAITVNAVGAYYRVRVQNIDVSATTYFRLQTINVPILSALPRSLSPDGWLQTQVNQTQDHSGFAAIHSPYGEQTVTFLHKLVGSAFSDSTLDTGMWTANIGTGGTVAPVSGILTMSTGTTANNSTTLSTIYNSRFLVGHANKVHFVMTLPDTGVANNTRRWGAFTATDGMFFELTGTTFNLVTRKAGVDTKVANGSFNGTLGGTIALDTNSRVFYAMITPSSIWWYYDNTLIHMSRFNTSWAASLNLPLRLENTNSGGSTTNVSMQVFSAIIKREGTETGAPLGRNFVGAQTTTLKYGAGALHAVVINVNSGTSITLYDNTAASGTILATITPNQLTTLDFKNISFSIGLTVVTVGVGVNCTIIYD